MPTALGDSTLPTRESMEVCRQLESTWPAPPGIGSLTWHHVVLELAVTAPEGVELGNTVMAPILQGLQQVDRQNRACLLQSIAKEVCANLRSIRLHSTRAHVLQ
eukprot:545881-Amphidinium_carterae.1